MTALILLTTARWIAPQRVLVFLKLPFLSRAGQFASHFNPFEFKKGADFLLALAGLVGLSTAITVMRLEGLALWPVVSWLSFFKVFFWLSAYLLFRNAVGALAGTLFSVEAEVRAVQNRFIAFFSWMGLLVLIPAMLMCLYPGWSQIYLNTGLVLMALGLTVTLIYTTLQVIRIPPNFGYNILYLCALEIIPLLYLIYIIKKV